MIIKSAKKINDTISKISSTIEIDVYYLSKYVEFYKKKDTIISLDTSDEEDEETDVGSDIDINLFEQSL